jgi:hypothetical protein
MLCMSNVQLTVVTVAVLLAHVTALAIAASRRRARPALSLNLVVAGATLVNLATDWRWLRPPLDVQVAGLAAFELLVLAMALLALAHHRPAVVGSWIAFGLHGLASVLAVVFVLTFKITRLI